MAKKKTVDSDAPKAMSLFDHITNIKSNKIPWTKISAVDRKSWSTYMVNRFMSMNWEYTELVNALQKYTIGIIPDGAVQRLYCELFPKDRTFHPYVKGKNETKFDSELVNIIKNHYLYSADEAEEYIQMILSINRDEIVRILKKYGKSEKEITKLLNV